MDYKKIFETILKKCKPLAESFGLDLAESFKKDISDFLRNIELEKIIVELTNKEITKAEFESLLKGKMDLAEMILLKNAGLSLVEINKFKNNLLQIIIETI